MLIDMGKEKMNVKKPKVIKTVIVLGAGRSGTSIVAGILQRIGVNMGNIELEPDGYKHGNFEDIDIRRLNETMLDVAGFSWYKPPFSPHDFKTLVVRIDKHNLVLRAAILFNKHSTESEKTGIWGWKDPRTILLLRHYIDLIENPYFIVVFRNQVANAQSMIARDGGSLEEALQLALHYNTLIVDYLMFSSYPRLYCTFESFFKESSKQLNRIIDFLGIKVGKEARGWALSLIDPFERHW
jgi:hypothetical protein